MADRITILPLAALHECPTNPRQHYDQAALQELADSLTSQGLLQPIVVRPLPDQQLHYEIVFGHRRFRAAQLAGLDSVPAILRDMTDQQVAEAQIAENLARADVNALEEAQSYHRLMREFGVTAKQIIEQTGKSKSYIYGRLKLLQLADEPRQALLAGQIDAEVAGLISRMPQAVQPDALDQVLIDGDGGPRGVSYREAKAALRHLVVDLEQAPFPLDVFGLAEKAACDGCADRAGNDPAMADMAPLSCARRACYQAKVAAWVQQQVDEAKAAGRRVIESDEAAEATRYGMHYLRGVTALDDEVWIRQGERMSTRELLQKTGRQDAAAVLVLPDDHKGPRLMEVVANEAMREAQRTYLASLPPEGDAAGERTGQAPTARSRYEDHLAELLAPLTMAERMTFDEVHWPKVLQAIASRVRHIPRTTDDLVMIAIALLDAGLDLGRGLPAQAFGWADRFKDLGYSEEQAASRILLATLSPADLGALLVLWALEDESRTHVHGMETTDDARAVAMRRLALAQRYGVDVHDPECMVQPAAVQTPAQVGDLFDGEAPSTPSTAAHRGDGAQPGAATASTSSTPSTAAPVAKGAKGPAVRYRCPATGSTWSGRGLQPAWVRAALKAGKTLADLSVDQIQTDEAGCAGHDQTDDAGVTAGERATAEATS